MANVVEMPPLAMAEPFAPQRSLKLLSRSLAVLFTFLAALQIAWVLAALIVTIFFSDHLLEGAAGFDFSWGTPAAIPGMVPYDSLPAITHVTGVILIAIAAAPFLLVFWNLRGLFRLYARGIVFAQQNAAAIKRIGLWLIAYAPTQIAVNIVFRMAGSLDKAWFHMELVYALVLGLIVLAIAQVMAFGHDIEQEKDSFV